MASNTTSPTKSAQHAHGECPKCEDLAECSADMLDALKAVLDAFCWEGSRNSIEVGADRRSAAANARAIIDRIEGETA